MAWAPLPGATYWPLPGSQKADWALSQLNLNNNFTASVLYELPFGKGKSMGSNWSGPVNAILGNWEVNVIEKVTSGFPLYVVDNNTAGPNFLFNGAFSLNRPDQVGDPNKGGPVAANPTCVAPAQVHTNSIWFNSCAFMRGSRRRTGDGCTGSGLWTRIREHGFLGHQAFPHPARGMQLDFRAEFFNLFNHPQFGLTGDSSTGMQTSGHTFQLRKDQSDGKQSTGDSVCPQASVLEDGLIQLGDC